QAGGYLPRLRAALPSFNRAGLQGRAQHRRVPPNHLRRCRRFRGAGPRIQLRYRQGGRGTWRFRGARRARAAPSARTSRQPRRGGFDGPRRGRPAGFGGSEPVKGESKMQLGVVGLGRMGGNIVRRLARRGHQCVVFDQNPAAIKSLVGESVTGGSNLGDLVRRLEKPRAVWLMLPSGEITEHAVVQLGDMLQSGDTIIDGGNSFYKDDIRRAKALTTNGIRYVDCGTSGGVWGLERGYCMMIGGEEAAVRYLDPIFKTLAPGVEAAA